MGFTIIIFIIKSPAIQQRNTGRNSSILKKNIKRAVIANISIIILIKKMGIVKKNPRNPKLYLLYLI